MTGAHPGPALWAGLIVVVIGGPVAMAQEGAPSVAPVPGSSVPAGAAASAGPIGGVFPAGPAIAPLAPAAPGAGLGSSEGLPPTPTTGCTCGDRWGLSRWRWHRANCKRHLQEHVLGYAEEFNEWPLGEALYAHARTQVANGQAARMVFYHYDFVDGSSELNLRGRDKLAAVAATLPTTFYPVVVERTPREPDLDASRRSALLTALAQGPFPIPAERVVIGPSIAHGMTGVESRLIFERQYANLGSGGAIGTAGAAGFVGGGLGFDAGGLSGGAITGGLGR
jgi:hypothetical protein